MNKELFIVATPIGNLQDITLRALEVLKTVNLVICEDTRHTGKLLKHFAISVPLISFHAYTNANKLDIIIKKILNCNSVALVSDAGTPGISDPGYVLIREILKYNVKITPIPGASAFLTALQASGASINHFLYLGFLPIKKGRQTLLKSFVNSEYSIVFYESVHRLSKTIQELINYLGEQSQIIIARELTKLHEEIFRGTLAEALKHFISPKGEFVIIIPRQN